MSMFNFVFGDSITCPGCQTKYDVQWNTEYGDPLEGDHNKVCPKCNCNISFECYIAYSQNSSQVTKQGIVNEKNS